LGGGSSGPWTLVQSLDFLNVLVSELIGGGQIITVIQSDHGEVVIDGKTFISVVHDGVDVKGANDYICRIRYCEIMKGTVFDVLLINCNGFASVAPRELMMKTNSMKEFVGGSCGSQPFDSIVSLETTIFSCFAQVDLMVKPGVFLGLSPDTSVTTVPIHNVDKVSFIGSVDERDAAVGLNLNHPHPLLN